MGRTRRAPAAPRAAPAADDKRRAAESPAKPAAKPAPLLTRPHEPVPFWKRKTLEAMTPVEWESLCDGCGRCCLVKLEDEDTGRILFTDVSCRLLDETSSRCRDYPNRTRAVPDCVRLTAKNVRTIKWLPPTCGYRLVAEGRDLYWWHPLVSGDADTVHQAGISVRGRLGACEDDVDFDELQDHLVQWPKRLPKRARKPSEGS